MARRHALAALAFLLALQGGLPALAEDEEDAASESESTFRWSLTPTVELRFVDPDEDDDGVTGFLDQYEFVPNESVGVPVELGLRDAALDWLGPAETPRLQLRYESPTSNLGVSGSQVGEPFWNQRSLILGRTPGIDFDLRYRRLRTEELRLFPNTAGTALVFEDGSDPDDRFARERTGFALEMRTDPLAGVDSAEWLEELAAPELSLRGGLQVRGGDRQVRSLIPTSNRWVGLAQERDQRVGDVGGGLLFAPGGLFTLALDVDHQRFREDEDAIALSSLPGGVSTSPAEMRFVPDTNRTTGAARLQGRFGDRVVIEAGLQGSLLEQVEDETALQRAAGLDDNRLLFASARFAADVAISGGLSANAFFGFDRRDNDIERDTALFNPGGTNGSQVGPFLEEWRRVRAGAEAVYRLNAGNLFALGGHYDAIDRDLEFSSAGCPPLPCFPAILPVNALVEDDSESFTVYGRTRLRVARRVGVHGEIGYREAPETGYATELDDYVYGRLRASYSLPVSRPVALTLLARGGSGESRDQTLVGGGGLGTPPAGPSLRRSFERSDWLAGLTASTAPWERVSLYGSLFLSQDEQEYVLALSSLTRYVQPLAPVLFAPTGSTDYQNQQWSAVLGAHLTLTETTDASLAYTFTRADTSYGDGSAQLAQIDRSAEIEATLHGAEFSLEHEVREGLRVLVGYRFELFQDGSDLPTSTGSAIPPFDPDTHRHTVTLGVTLTSALLDEP